MSSPSSGVGGNNSSVGIREGTRVILREITANLQNSPPGQSSRRKSGNDAASIKGDQQQHDVKVRFIREFADAGASGREANTESSLSSASSFQSLTSTLSSKCSSGICVDSSPTKVCDASYLSSDIPGLDDLISACENIRLTDNTIDPTKDQSFTLQPDSDDLSGDQTFTSAVDRNSPIDRNIIDELDVGNSPVKFSPNVTHDLDATRDINEDPEISVTNAFFECASANVDEAAFYHRTNSELESVTENFVQCVSDLAQIESAKVDETALKNLDDGDREKSEEIREKLEISIENKNEDDSKVEDIDIAENPTSPVDRSQENLNVTFERPSHSIVDDVAVESNGTAEIGEHEVAEEIPQSVFDVTVDVPYDLKGIEGTEPFNPDDTQPIPAESSPNRIFEDISKLETVERYEPVAPALSELNEISQCPSLPTLSSICLRATLTQTDDVSPEIPDVNVRPNEENIVAVAVPSLSDKFADIAAKDISPGNSISTIKEPTFLNDQKLGEDFIEFAENPSSPVKVETALTNVDDVDDLPNLNNENANEVKNPIEPRTIDFSEFKIPAPPTDKPTARAVSPSPSRTEDANCESETIEKIGTENPIDPEIVCPREADVSANSDDLDDTVTIQDISAGNIFVASENDQYAQFRPQQQSTALTVEKSPTCDLNDSGLVAGTGFISGDNSVSKPIPVVDEYAAFLPQQQSTTLTGFAARPFAKLERQPTPFVIVAPPHEQSRFNGDNNKSPDKPVVPIDDRCNFEKLELAAQAVANDIYNTSREIEDETSGNFVTATSDFFDPLDFLLSKTPKKNPLRNLRAESLYVKFDPLVSNTSMLPQGNIQNTSPPVNEKTNGDNNESITSIGTPKRNPAIAAIDRLLFYSPMTTATTPTTDSATIQKTNVPQEKAEPTEETSAETVNMAKELELVRSTVIQLEEQVEKLKIDNEEASEKQSSYQEKINQLQIQLAQEIKNKNQITVVVDEYEKSISRLVAERERDRKNLDLEKAKLQEELAAAKHHLDNTEAAFNDVHLKYERLKAVVATYKNNEAELKQSVQENVEIIKSLENRYEQVKEHATARLEKANQDLDAIRKQNESETVRLHAMLRKAELKSNSLAELVEQKTKENKELTQILDEVIARVGRNKSE